MSGFKPTKTPDNGIRSGERKARRKADDRCRALGFTNHELEKARENGAMISEDMKTLIYFRDTPSD